MWLREVVERDRERGNNTESEEDSKIYRLLKKMKH